MKSSEKSKRNGMTYKRRYQKLVEWLHAYSYSRIVRLENEIIEFENHVVYRKADPVDHLEMIIALAKLEAAEQDYEAIRSIIDISQGL